MTPINFHKKEKPLTSLVSLGGGAAGMANAGLAGKTYVEDVYKSYPYRGNGDPTQTITTGLDISGDGGLVWVKNRTDAAAHTLQDSLVGDNKYISTSSANGTGENDTRIKTITSTGFQVGGDGDTGASTKKYASFNFKKKKAFFDLVEYTGNSDATQTLSHDLGCVPGCFMLKSFSVNGDWRVWHRSIQPNTTQYGITLNGYSATYGTIDEFGSTDPTATQFTVGGNKNTDGVTYRCYLFAGNGYSRDGAYARSVDFDGSDDNVVPSQVMLPSGQDSNQFCVETWFKTDTAAGPDVIYGQYLNPQPGRMMFHYDGNQIHLWMGGSTQAGTGPYSVFPGQWYHVAWTYDGTHHRLFLDGIMRAKLAGSSLPAGIEQSNPMIGNSSAGWILDGQLSNFRITLDQAVYTTSFKPSTEPLTTTSQGVTGTNCKILCFNNTSVTHNSSSSGITLTASGGPTASTVNPFPDSDCFKFGDEGDQDIIKCGSYIGNGTGGDNGVVVNLGWQPQYLLMKNTANVGTDGTWLLIDDIRGIASDNADAVLLANNANAEVQWQRVSLTSRGFKLTDSNPQVNGSTNEILYIAVRGPDPLVTKPPEAGTDVFAMDVGNGVTAIPPGNFDSGFPVDLGIMREPASNSQWYTTSRLQRFGYVRTNDTNAEAQGNPSFAKDSNVGWGEDTYSNNWMAWMWKKYQGFDTVAYTGNGNDYTGSVAAREIQHNLGRPPEMIWLKARTQSSDRDWYVGHIGINDGVNPWNGFIKLNDGSTQFPADNQAWNSTPPTSTSFSIGNAYAINHDGYEHIALLFASVTGISKVGYYTGNGETLSNGKFITTGFLPRFVLLKRTDGSGNWYTMDSLRGWGTPGSNTTNLYLNGSGTENGSTFVEPDANGFRVVDDSPQVNGDGNKYIYYAHA